MKRWIVLVALITASLLSCVSGCRNLTNKQSAKKNQSTVRFSIDLVRLQLCLKCLKKL